MGVPVHGTVCAKQGFTKTILEELVGNKYMSLMLNLRQSAISKGNFCCPGNKAFTGFHIKGENA
jgi:hypothetical protein